jgi:hypothetical protein
VEPCANFDVYLAPALPTTFSRAPRAAVAAATLWVRGPVWDAVWMQSALCLLPLVLWFANSSGAGPGPLDILYFGLTALFWIGHRLSSTWIAYGTEAYRPLVKAQPVRFIVLPLLVTAACFAILLPPDAALPWTRTERFIVLAITDYACSTYHFAAQHFGALSLYRARAGSAAGASLRRIDRWFALGVGGVLIFVADALAGSVAYQDKWLGKLFVPAWLASQQHLIHDGSMIVLVAVTAAMLLRELHAPRISLPRILYIVGLAGMVAVALRPRGLFLFVATWTSQHWILATGLASRVPIGEAAPESGGLRSVLHALNVRPWAILALLALISVLLLPVFEVEANWQSTLDPIYYGDRIFGALVTALRTSSWLPGLLALGCASGFVHYLQDRNIYRMSDPGVRAAASGLLAPQ